MNYSDHDGAVPAYTAAKVKRMIGFEVDLCSFFTVTETQGK